MNGDWEQCANPSCGHLRKWHDEKGCRYEEPGGSGCRGKCTKFEVGTRTK